MALQTLAGGGIHIPARPEWTPNISWTHFAIDAAGEKVAFIFRVNKTGTITKVGFQVGDVTTSATLRVSLQTLDASGNPSGTLYGGSTAGTQTSPAAYTFYEVTLGTGAAATAGDYVAAVIEFDSTVGNLTILTIFGSIQEFPYTAQYTTTGWSKFKHLQILSIGYSDGTYANVGTIPLYRVPTVSFASPNERALRFLLPFSARVIGYWMVINISGNADIVLYEGTTAKATVSLSANYAAGSNAIVTDYFPTPYVISRNTEYFLAVKPLTATNVATNEYTVTTAALWNCFNGGPEFHFASRPDGASAWTTDTLRRLWAGIIVDQLDDGVGGGGGGGGMKVHLGMDGGMRG